MLNFQDTDESINRAVTYYLVGKSHKQLSAATALGIDVKDIHNEALWQLYQAQTSGKLKDGAWAVRICRSVIYAFLKKHWRVRQIQEVPLTEKIFSTARVETRDAYAASENAMAFQRKTLLRAGRATRRRDLKIFWRWGAGEHYKQIASDYGMSEDNFYRITLKVRRDLRRWMGVHGYTFKQLIAEV